ncbi:MAG: type II secretion system F family protein [Candidatus Woesearchaeota archaeon]|jgi:flagellar protein FlaJ|nr:type II secretion system F family protein [Candidatus Woesearchaeota archaeon]
MKLQNISGEEIIRYVLLVLTFLGFFFAIRYSLTNITSPVYVNIFLVLPFIIFLTPYLFLSLYGLKRVESKMQVIPRFLRDIVDNVESGMDLISSIKNTVNNEYGVLNEDVKKLFNQISWGIDFDVAMINFAKNIGSSTLKRDLYLVIEARKIGGHVEKILRELSLKIGNENLRTKERRSNLASNTFTGYISFIIFLVIIVMVYKYLFVGITETINPGAGGVSDGKIETFLSLLTLLSYELAILSGFLFGLMQDNNIINGAPHVVALVISVFVTFFFFI